jgi:hypothetical protein
MTLTVKPIRTKKDLEKFIHFPWTIYHSDKNWVPPLLADRISKLDIDKNPFWQTAEREIWLAEKDCKPAGTIAAIFNHRRNEKLKDDVGMFGFFESIDDPTVARGLVDAATFWLKDRKLKKIRGPYNPSETDEVGILVEGFDTRPAILEAHTPSYYPALLESAGLIKFQEIVARMRLRPPELRDLAEALPEKFIKVARLVKKRPDLVIRPVDMKHWDSEIHLACDIYNQALSTLPEYIPLSQDEFREFANSFKSIMDPNLGRLATVNGKPVGFALALPDFNQALQHVNGKLDLPGLLKLMWFSRRLDRVSFKILVMIPEFIGSGIETLLTLEICEEIIKKGYKEVDMSLTGDENEKSNRYQENLGMQVYRRYRIYEKDL